MHNAHTLADAGSRSSNEGWAALYSKVNKAPLQINLNKGAGGDNSELPNT